MNRHSNLLSLAATIVAVLAWLMPAHHAAASNHPKANPATVVQDNTRYTSRRPATAERLFRSDAIEREIVRVKKLLTNQRLAWMFENCFPNTLDTTVHYRHSADGRDNTFVYTGDIHAMWLRDSGAQVWPYVRFANNDPHLKSMLRGVILRQWGCINIDPYANAFNDGPTGSEWDEDLTDMKPELHERKYEIDSLCYPLRLAYHYWQVTGDTTIFGADWLSAIRHIVTTFREQQRKEDLGPYKFQRVTERATDTMQNDGYGHPANPVGLIVSAFRPSDDATTFPFLVPSNFFAVSSLRKAAEILTRVNRRDDLAAECTALADEVEAALRQYAVYNHPAYGPIYAFEVDGYGNHLLMDDANVPSLLAMAYLGDVPADDPVYLNTRRFVWSTDNPYFFRGPAGEGIGGPHTGYNMIWPMSIMMKAFTATDDAEISACLRQLMRTDAGTGFMHESFSKDDAAVFTRPWFAWQNTLFGELILTLIDHGKLDLLNSLDAE
jgi:meiotically up-regulated gene 157 (Mug157) protein